MRRYKYRSLPQKFIGNFRYGDSSRMTYPTSQRGLYPWVAKGCELTTTSNPNSFVNNDVTVWPTCVPSAADNNAIEFEVVDVRYGLFKSVIANTYTLLISSI